ncbi:MAG: type II toxin-antitoxin system HicB family antitoxin [Selenomonadaceae bacterium]|nr:type II toxin-antitoxin system HicB family antitoxin [Selenomonadaceae bacterium]
MKYVYPAIFEEAQEGGYIVTFPDIGGATEGDTIEEALAMAEDALSLALVAMEDDHDKIPAPTSPFQIQLKEKQFVSLVKANTNAYRAMMPGSKGNEEQKIA